MSTAIWSNAAHVAILVHCHDCDNCCRQFRRERLKIEASVPNYEEIQQTQEFPFLQVFQKT
jgi:hypothetical protein